jgi:hypothetical protein
MYHNAQLILHRISLLPWLAPNHEPFVSVFQVAGIIGMCLHVQPSSMNSLVNPNVNFTSRPCYIQTVKISLPYGLTYS